MTTRPLGRCECRAGMECPGKHNPPPNAGQCFSWAVRLVTVPPANDRGTPLRSDPPEWWPQIPMCEPCAKHHEAHV